VSATPFSPIPARKSASDACADALRERILSGELAPGSRLPPERELAAAFGVNRLTLRNSLSRLADSGLLSVRQGSGYLVQDFRRCGGPALLPELVNLRERPGELLRAAHDLLLVRRKLAAAVLESLAQADPPLDTIREAIARYQAMAGREPSVQETVAADLAVVSAIVEATGSIVVQLCLNPIAQTLSALPALERAIYADPVRAAEGYAILLAWMETRALDQIPLAMAALAARDEETLATLRRSLSKETR